MAAGYAVFHYEEDDLVKSSDGIYRNIPAIGIIHENYETMKAGLKIASEFEGGDAYRISWNLFSYDDAQMRIINYAKRIFGANND